MKLSSGLQAAEPPASFKHLPKEERQAIFEIISATLPNLPVGWKRRSEVTKKTGPHGPAFWQ